MLSPWPPSAFGIASAPVLPLVVVSRSKWPQGRDWLGVAALGVLFFGIFFVIYNAALHYTTAARGSCALDTPPRNDAGRCTARTRSADNTENSRRADCDHGCDYCTGNRPCYGACECVAGGSPYGWWDALYGSLHSPGRGPSWRALARLGFLTAGMGFGSAASTLVAWHSGGFAATHNFSLVQGLSVLSIGAFGGAAAFGLWVYALERTTPTRVANTMTVNLITASLIATLIIGEAVGVSLIVGMVAVFIGIWIASTER